MKLPERKVIHRVTFLEESDIRCNLCSALIDCDLSSIEHTQCNRFGNVMGTSFMDEEASLAVDNLWAKINMACGDLDRRSLSWRF